MRNKYVIAVSGGVDSMYLATMLATKNQAAAFVHINHHTRGEANELEAKLVLELGKQYNLPVYIYDYHHQQGNFQSCARDFRYQMLCKVASQYGYKIATAHHLDDQLENCLISPHLVKSNLIEYRSQYQQCFIYRPLIGITKAQIYKFAVSLNVKFNEDVSNMSLDYSRNQHRNQLKDSAYRQVAMNNYIMEHNKLYYKQNRRVDDYLDRNYLINKSLFFRLQAIYYYIKSVDSQISIKNRQLLSINDLLQLKKNSKYSIANCNILFVGYDKIYMLASDDEISSQAFLKLGRNEFNGIIFDSTDISGSIRTWQPGDKVEIKDGHKKVARIFIDNKIEEPLRKKWPIIINDSGEIIEIPQLWRKNEINQ